MKQAEQQFTSSAVGGVSTQSQPAVKRIPMFTRSVGVHFGPADNAAVIQVCAGVSSEEMLGSMHLMNIYIRDLASGLSRDCDESEPDAEIGAAAAALRYLTHITCAMSEAILNGTDKAPEVAHG